MAAKLDYAEVAKHNTKEDAWVIVDNTVYDLTSFAPSHPGGAKYIHKYAGKVATEEFLAKYARTHAHPRVDPFQLCAPPDRCSESHSHSELALCGEYGGWGCVQPRNLDAVESVRDR